MLGRKREDLTAKAAASSKNAKKRKWQEESSEDDDDDAAAVTQEDMDAWKRKIEEEEKEEEKERERKEREAKEEADRREKEYQERIEKEERDRKEEEERLETQERERQAQLERERRAEVLEKAKQQQQQQLASQLAVRLEAQQAAARIAAARVLPGMNAETVRATIAAAAVAAAAAAAGESAGWQPTQGLPGAWPELEDDAADAAAVPSDLATIHVQAPAARGDGPPRCAQEQHATVHVQVPAARVKDLLGVQGRNIKALKTNTGVQRVGVLDRNDPANVEIVGPPASVEKCRRMVLAIVDGDLSVVGNVTEVMDIDARLISKLIGPKGQMISRLKDLTGAYLAVRDTDAGSAPKVIITGFPECVDKAREMVDKFLRDQGSALQQAAGGQPHLPVLSKPSEALSAQTGPAWASGRASAKGGKGQDATWWRGAGADAAWDSGPAESLRAAFEEMFAWWQGGGDDWNSGGDWNGGGDWQGGGDWKGGGAGWKGGGGAGWKGGHNSNGSKGATGAGAAPSQGTAAASSSLPAWAQPDSAAGACGSGGRSAKSREVNSNTDQHSDSQCDHREVSSAGHGGGTDDGSNHGGHEWAGWSNDDANGRDTRSSMGTTPSHDSWAPQSGQHSPGSRADDWARDDYRSHSAPTGTGLSNARGAHSGDQWASGPGWTNESHYADNAMVPRPAHVPRSAYDRPVAAHGSYGAA
eukprot:TRINITY_DN10468_c0_g2_i1.p1 TRINITY_DN10468_c0_g2~~TRINITY_DN10468_c0_g2_i1.p1  ORF type:complete len:701 (-),score=186.47 TRINITY_DN10468_c0_g2_i1:44-2146(-)